MTGSGVGVSSRRANGGGCHARRRYQIGGGRGAPPAVADPIPPLATWPARAKDRERVRLRAPHGPAPAGGEGVIRRPAPSAASARGGSVRMRSCLPERRSGAPTGSVTPRGGLLGMRWPVPHPAVRGLDRLAAAEGATGASNTERPDKDAPPMGPGSFGQLIKSHQGRKPRACYELPLATRREVSAWESLSGGPCAAAAGLAGRGYEVRGTGWQQT